MFPTHAKMAGIVMTMKTTTNVPVSEGTLAITVKVGDNHWSKAPVKRGWELMRVETLSDSHRLSSTLIDLELVQILMRVGRSFRYRAVISIIIYGFSKFSILIG